jgi:antitoxin ParD1/3/4
LISITTLAHNLLSPYYVDNERVDAVNLSLGKHWDDYLASLVGSGHYASASEAVRDSLRLLQAEEVKLAALREKIDASVKRGGANSDEHVGAGVTGALDEWERQRPPQA